MEHPEHTPLPGTRTKRYVSTPAEADTIIEARIAQLGFASYSEYVNSLTQYDCTAQVPHLLTADSARTHKGRTTEAELEMWRCIKSLWGKTRKDINTWVEVRLAHLLGRRQEQKDAA
jgi:hypothetical protein